MNNKPLDKFSVKAFENNCRYDISIINLDLRIADDNKVFGFDIVYRYNNHTLYIQTGGRLIIDNVNEALSIIEKDIQTYNGFCLETYNLEHNSFFYKNFKLSNPETYNSFIKSYGTYGFNEIFLSYIDREVNSMGEEYSFSVLYSKIILDFSDIDKVKKFSQNLRLS